MPNPVRTFDTPERATELARNPKLNRALASDFQRQIDKLKKTDSLHPKGTGPLLPRRANLIAFDSEQERLRQEFVDAEVERRFGSQTATSGTTTINAQGQRVQVGHGPGIQATPAQRNEIAGTFQTPLQRLKSGKSESTFRSSLPPPSVNRPGDPTIVGGAGIQRRKLRSGTILSSDDDQLAGGSTILG